jgi:hypothetical protein
MLFWKDMSGRIRKIWAGHGAWLFCGISLLLLAGCATQSRNPAISQERAACICSFGEFVEWPQNVFAGTNAPLVIGIYGADTLGGKLQSIAKNRRISGRAVVVKPVQTEAEMKRCQILFISDVKHGLLTGAWGRFSTADLSQIASELSSAGVLTVSENVEHFSESGIMINLFDGVDRTHFEINAAAANRAGLQISAKLLALAGGIQE